jgi:hypothetical protein
MQATSRNAIASLVPMGLLLAQLGCVVIQTFIAANGDGE